MVVKVCFQLILSFRLQIQCTIGGYNTLVADHRGILCKTLVSEAACRTSNPSVVSTRSHRLLRAGCRLLQTTVLTGLLGRTALSRVVNWREQEFTQHSRPKTLVSDHAVTVGTIGDLCPVLSRF